MVQPIDTQLSAVGFTISLQGGRPENQDAVRSQHTPLGTVIIVCDGMGGMQGGRIASEIAVNTILDTIIRAEAQSNPEMTLIKAIRNANMAILQEGQMNANLKGMGTTAAVVLLSEKSALIAYVGDTRIYQLRNRRKVYRTFDHSMVFEMVRKNVITEEQARLSAQSNIILRALGVKPDLEVETAELPYRKGDKFLLCSDGFWGCLPEKEFLRLLDGHTRMDRKLEEAARRIDQLGRQKGGDHDNLTAALITMNANSILKEKMNRTAKITIAALSALLAISLGFNVHWMTGHLKEKVSGVEVPGATSKPAAEPQTDASAPAGQEEEPAAGKQAKQPTSESTSAQTFSIGKTADGKDTTEVASGSTAKQTQKNPEVKSTGKTAAPSASNPPANTKPEEEPQIEQEAKDTASEEIATGEQSGSSPY